MVGSSRDNGSKNVFNIFINRFGTCNVPNSLLTELYFNDRPGQVLTIKLFVRGELGNTSTLFNVRLVSIFRLPFLPKLAFLGNEKPKTTRRQ